MPVETKRDPYKPEQPILPGVEPAEKRAEAAPRTAAPPPAGRFNAPRQGAGPSGLWMAIIVGGIFALAAASYFGTRNSAPKPGAAEADMPTEAEAPDASSKFADNLPIAPGPIAAVGELAAAWSAKRFQFRDPITAQIEPALVVRLPRGEYWGFSLREPYGTCELQYITDLAKLQARYGFRAQHPMVVNPCNSTVYDLMRYGGGAANGGLVRGEIVQGRGIRPPIAIEIRIEGNKVVAARVE